ncbi:MAG TPA: RNA-binding protein [Candidatus Aminicenantes bacterium]|nr:RNA-binding protein [Candidatus Aminicenantes bacterium]
MKSNKLFVANLDYSVIEIELEELFTSYGRVQAARIIRDRKTGRSRGFAFVTMSSIQEAETAKMALGDTNFKGRKLKIDEAKKLKKKKIERRIKGED